MHVSCGGHEVAVLLGRAAARPLEEIRMTPTDAQAISYLRDPDEEERPWEIREHAELFQSKLGFVPNIVRSFDRDRCRRPARYRNNC